MSEEDEIKACTCGANFADALRSPPPKKDWLRKTRCSRCGKVYWTNKDTDYCMNCEPLVSALSKSGSD